MGIFNRFSTKQKVGIGIGGALGLAGAGLLGKRLLKGRSRKGGRYPVKRGSVARLKTSIQRLRLKTLKIKEQKKLFKEQLKV